MTCQQKESGVLTPVSASRWRSAEPRKSTTRGELRKSATKPLMRAYSIASANWEEELEFFSIKVQDGPLTSRLQHLKPGDPLLVSKKPTGTLVLRDLKPGRRLFMFATGTGLAPFMSLIHDPETYERFEKVILIHGVR